ncbi:MAG: hypothetical protein K0U68_10285 [Gammaproteobacteria bacterium]|nr:hypothetical protein [Gammaproteobacteria bacterium]
MAKTVKLLNVGKVYFETDLLSKAKQRHLAFSAQAPQSSMPKKQPRFFEGRKGVMQFLMLNVG